MACTSAMLPSVWMEALRISSAALLFAGILALQSSTVHAVDGSGSHTRVAHGSPKSVPSWAQAIPYGPTDQLFTSMDKGPGFRMYHNVWWHNHRWFAMVKASQVNDITLFDDGLSVNQVLTRIPVLDLQAYAEASKVAFLPGVSALLDYPFQSYQEHLGHWAEITVPLYSVLADGEWRQLVQRHTTQAAAGSDTAVLDRVVMPNLNRDINQWFKAVLSAACKPAVTSSTGMPNLLDYAELFTYDNLAWLVFENVLVVDDRYTHPQAKRGFVSVEHGDLWRHDNCERYVSPTMSVQFAKPEHGKQFRRSLWEANGLGTPSEWVPGTPPVGLPKFMTLLLPAGDDWPGITNQEELRQALEVVAAEHGLKTRVISLSNGAAFGSHLEAVSGSAVLVGRHTPLMASAMLLPPGAMVLELLPYKWEWAKISMLYFNITQSVGDIHHVAWRPQHYKWAQFKNSSDLRYHTWTPEECEAYECLNKLVKAGIIADIPTISDMLRSKLPAVLGGQPVELLREPWPKAV